MNILNLEVRLKKIKIKTHNNAPLSFSLRLGRVLSIISAPVSNKIDSPIQPNIDLIIGCDQNMINNSSRATLAIYESRPSENPQIIGMVFIMLKGTQGEMRRYKIQQSNDIHSFAQLTFMITNLQLKENQNNSLASKSSLAEIRQLHRVLSRDHKRKSSDLSDQQKNIKKARLSPQDKERQLRSRNNNKIPHLKSEQTPFGDEDPSYAILLRKAQVQLVKQKQRNSLLTNLLVIQQQKNNQSQNFIRQMLIYQQSIKGQLINNNVTQFYSPRPYTSQQNSLEAPVNNENEQTSKLKAQRSQQKISRSQEKIDNLIKQRDQLYNISQQLYQKTKKYKIQNEKMFKSIKALQNQLKLYQNQIQELKLENLQLKSKLFEAIDIKNKNGKITQKGDSSLLFQQNQRLKNQNAQYQRKFKQSYRAIDEFKNIAWKAQQEVITKEQQIASLKQQLEQIKNGSINRQQSRQFSSDQHTGDQKQLLKHTLQTFKLMSALIMKNNLQRNEVLRVLQNLYPSYKQKESKQRDMVSLTLIAKIKEKIGNIFQQFEKQNKKTVQVFEMRKKIFETINQINF